MVALDPGAAGADTGFKVITSAQLGQDGALGKGKWDGVAEASGNGAALAGKNRLHQGCGTAGPADELSSCVTHWRNSKAISRGLPSRPETRPAASGCRQP